MGDVNTPVLACRDCGAEIVRAKPRGRPPSLCPECRLASDRRSKRSFDARSRAGIAPQQSLVCSDCSAPFDRSGKSGPAAKRCPACTERWIRERDAPLFKAISEALAAERASRFERRGRWSACLGCGVRLACTRMGKAREWCKECWPNHVRNRRQNWRDRNPEAWRAIVARFTAKRRSAVAIAACERFDPMEVFERDRWICQICHRRISKVRRWPDPLSVSLDHVIPLSLGGPHSKANTRAAHLRCNVSRSNKGGGEQLALIG